MLAPVEKLPVPLPSGPEPLSSPQASTPEALEACLLFLLDHYGKPMSLAALRAGVARPDEFWKLEHFVDAIESLGFSTQTVRLAEPPSPAPNEPLVLLGHDGQALVLVSREGPDDYEVFVPEHGRTKHLNFDELMAQYAGTCLRVHPPMRVPSSEAGVPRGRRGHWFWGPIAIGRPLYLRAGLAAVLTSVFALASSIFSMIVYDRVIPNNALGSLYALLFGVGIVFASDFVIRTLRAYFLDVAGSRADTEIADAVFDHVLDLDMRSRRGPTGSLANVLKEYETLRDFFTSSTLTTLFDIPFALLFVLAMYFIGGPMAWVPVIAIVLMIVVGLVLQPSMKSQSQTSQEDSQSKQAVLVETLHGLETIKALGAGAVMRRRWQESVAHQARIGMKMRLLGTLGANWSNMVFMVAQVATVTVGVFLAMDGQLGAGAIIAGSILCGRAIQPFSQLSQLMIRMNQSLASYKALCAVMALPREHVPGQPRLAYSRLRGSIELNDVSFRYPGQQMPILDKVTLRIEPGERVAIIGRVGSGKSTLTKLLLGMYPPDEGKLLIGGHDIRQIDPADLRRNIGSVLQDIWLMTGTLRQNIALGANRPTDEQVMRAAELAGVQEFASLHPEGYQLKIGEHGEGLSGGQRQAVAIARALIGDAPMLILDEPTSAMDPTAERQLLTQLKFATQGKTLVLITHKPSMLELVDKVIVLDRGKIVAQGPKDKVMRVAAVPPVPPKEQQS
jgi:ATP-binding cassette, subfamily C, bacterial LapB